MVLSSFDSVVTYRVTLLPVGTSIDRSPRYRESRGIIGNLRED